jgi:homoserine kinase type II
VASYTNLSRAQVDEIVAAYPLRLRDVSPMSGGAANSSYLLDTDAGAYVLTILNNHDEASATQLETVMEHLVAHGIPTNRPLRARDGEALAWFGDRPVMLKEFVTGTCGEPLPDSRLAASGELLARVHTVPVPPRLPRNHRRLPDGWLTVAKEFEDQTFAAWLHDTYEIAAPVLDLDGPAGLVHGDYFADNLVIGDDGQIAILDWETAGHDLLVLDLGMAIVGLCRRKGDFRPKLSDELIAGYERRRSLAEPERELLYEAVLYSSLVIAYHRYRRHHLTHPDPAKANLYLEIPRFVDSVSTQWQVAKAGATSCNAEPRVGSATET